MAGTALKAETTPPETIATVSSLDSHVINLFSALSGSMVAVRVAVPPAASESVVLSSLTLDTPMDSFVHPASASLSSRA